MTRAIAMCGLLAASGLAGCAPTPAPQPAAPPQRDLVVLAAQPESGEIGRLVVTTSSGTVELARAGESTAHSPAPCPLQCVASNCSARTGGSRFGRSDHRPSAHTVGSLAQANLSPPGTPAFARRPYGTLLDTGALVDYDFCQTCIVDKQLHCFDDAPPGCIERDFVFTGPRRRSLAVIDTV